jgi:CubicO group peptidase (beta-lactamase class C family)
MTATMIALLVERGDLAWDKTLPQLFPELAGSIDAGFADVTLVELLAHRAGLRTMTGRDEVLARCQRLPGTPTEQRRELVKAVLCSPPASKPREKHEYSNAGLIIAGAAAERATGKPWEALMRELLFEPLGMTTAGFGAPADADAAHGAEQPRGHHADGKPIEPGPGADNPALLGPAGTCHMSLSDWAKYLRLHLQGARGDVRVGKITLRAATFARLHTPYPGTGARYGYGWGVATRAWAAGDHTVLTHSGSNVRWFCVTWLDPAAGFGVLATTNIAGDGASKGTDAACALLLQEWLGPRPAGAASRPSTRATTRKS